MNVLLKTVFAIAVVLTLGLVICTKLPTDMGTLNHNVVIVNPPQTTAPQNGTPQSLALTLSWSGTGTTYHVQVATDTTFLPATIIVDLDTLNALSIGISGLSHGTTYYWRVKATDASFHESKWSAVGYFTTVAAPAKPAAPLLALPDDKSPDVAVPTTLSWHSVAVAGVSASYRVRVSKDTIFAGNKVRDTVMADTTYIAGTLDNSTQYFWQVQSKLSGDTSVWSATRSFTTISAKPAIPELSVPANNAVDQPIPLTVQWKAANHAVTYRIQVSTDTNFTVGNLTDTVQSNVSKLLGTLAISQKYFWRVKAFNPGDSSDWSATWCFTTLTPMYLPPTPRFPVNNAQNQAVTLAFGWSPIADTSVRYEIQVSSKNDFTDTVFTRIVHDTTVAQSILGYDSTYFWRVRSVGGAGVSVWTSSWTFATVPGMPPSPGLSSPIDSAVSQSVSPRFSWHWAKYAARYRLQIAINSNFIPMVFDDSTLTDSVYTSTKIQLSTSMPYFWRVQAINTLAQPGSWSSVRTFTTVPGLPQIPDLLSPQDSAPNQSISPKFAWHLAKDAVRYRLQISVNTNFTPTVFNDSTLTDSAYTFTSQLSNSTTYFWQVQAINALGQPGSWAKARRFTTSAATVLPPDVPVLKFPTSGDTNQPLAPTLKWSFVNNAEKYVVQVVHDTMLLNRLTFLDTISCDSVVMRVLGNDSTYYWRVQSVKGASSSSFSTWHSFKTIKATPTLTAPTLISPSNGGKNQATSTMLQWSKVGNGIRYYVVVSQNESLLPVFWQDTVDTTSAAIPKVLGNDTTYYWRVMATSNNFKSSPWSATWSFTTIIPKPEKPTLILPTINATDLDLPVIIKWKNIVADSFHIMVSTDTTFKTGKIYDSTLTDTMATLKRLVNSTSYFWKVCAINIAGYGDWSDTRKFTTIVDVPPPPVLDGPDDGSYPDAISNVLSYHCDNATKSWVQISTDIGFSSLIISDSLFVPNRYELYKSFSFKDGNTYYWRVRAGNAAGWGGLSATWKIVCPAKPTALELKSPKYDTTIYSNDIKFSWYISGPNGAQARRYLWELNIVSAGTYYRVGPCATDTSIWIDSSATYFWRVKAISYGGDSSNWSAYASFKTSYLPSATLVSPLNLDTVSTLTPTLIWNKVSGATKYNLEVFSYNGLVRADTLHDTSTTIPSALQKNMRYSWRLRAGNNMAWGSWGTSNLRIFFTKP